MKSIAKLCYLAAPLFMLILAACASIFTLNKDTLIPTRVTNPNPTPIAQYIAYGDSITAGYELASPSTQFYPALVAAVEGVSVADHAGSGEMSCDIPTTQIFLNGTSPSLSPHLASSILTGTNDVEVKGTGAYEPVFILCHMASLSWLAVPAEYKALANGSGMKTTGPGSLDTSNHWNAWTTGGQGATVSFSIVSTLVGPIYAWPRISDSNPATYAYSLDGLPRGTASTQTSPLIATLNGVTNSLGFIRLPVVAAGKHVVTFTQTSVGSNGVSVVGIGIPGGPSTDTLPTVFAGTVPYQYPGPSGGQCTAAAYAPCQQYTQDIEADVSLLAADGLDIRLFDTGKFLSATAADMTDTLHPNALGHIELSHAVESVW
jgi:lysophospholipase L1-like esterase